MFLIQALSKISNPQIPQINKFSNILQRPCAFSPSIPTIAGLFPPAFADLISSPYIH